MQINEHGNEGENVVCQNYEHDYVRQGMACADIVDGSCRHSRQNLPDCQRVPRYNAQGCPHNWPILPGIVTFFTGLDCPRQQKLCVQLVHRPQLVAGEVENDAE